MSRMKKPAIFNTLKMAKFGHQATLSNKTDTISFKKANQFYKSLDGT